MRDIPILSHGVIGNGQVLALVSPSTHVEWLCLPRFDSPSVFARLLDTDRGGSFGFDVSDDAQMKMEYVVNTNVLRTSVTSADGDFDIFDYAPRVPSGLGIDAPAEIHRVLVPRNGHPRVRVHFQPRPDDARVDPEIAEVAHGLDVRGGPSNVFLRSNAPAPYLTNGLWIRLDQALYFILSCGAPSALDSMPAVQQTLQHTIDGWRAWAKTCALPSFGAREVLRSALCLKLHAFNATGAIIAATTTSIPEAVGTERTWDYRFCWLRDAAFVVEALRRLSHLAEGEAFVGFLRDVAEQGPLQPLYGIGGERDLPEERLDHLAGFAGSRPVRIGNAAYLQKQHDLVGEMVLCLETLLTDPRVVTDDMTDVFRLVERLVEDAIVAAPLDDTGCGSSDRGCGRTPFRRSSAGWRRAAGPVWPACSGASSLRSDGINGRRHSRPTFSMPPTTRPSGSSSRRCTANTRTRPSCCCRRSGSSTHATRASSRRSAPTSACWFEAD